MVDADQSQLEERDGRKPAACRRELEPGEPTQNQINFIQLILEAKPTNDIVKLRPAFVKEQREWQDSRQEKKRALCCAFKQQNGVTILEPLWASSTSWSRRQRGRPRQHEDYQRDEDPEDQ